MNDEEKVLAVFIIFMMLVCLAASWQNQKWQEEYERTIVIGDQPILDRSFYLNDSQTFVLEEVLDEKKTGRNTTTVRRFYLENFSTEMMSKSLYASINLCFRTPHGTITKIYFIDKELLSTLDLQNDQIVEIRLMENDIIAYHIIDYAPNGKPSYRPYS